MPHTLTNQEMLDDELPLCEERDASILIGAPFASGIVSAGARANAYYRYQPANPEILERVGRMESGCERYSVPLPAANLQFFFGHPAVALVIPGCNSPEQFCQISAWMLVDIANEFWQELKSAKFIDPASPIPAV